MARKKNSTSKTAKSNNNAKQSMYKMKYEIANEFGVNLGPDASSRSNGSVGGEMTKRLVNKGKGSKNSK